MTRRKLVAAPVLLLLATLMCAGAAWGASILNSASQIGQVVSPPGNSGSFLISNMQMVSPSGQLQPFTTPPENMAYIVTKIIWSFMATDSTLTESVALRVGDYYLLYVQLSGGFCSAVDGGDPGVPITNLSPLVFVQKSGDPDKKPIPGKLHLRLIGYVAKIN